MAQEKRPTASAASRGMVEKLGDMSEIEKAVEGINMAQAKLRQVTCALHHERLIVAWDKRHGAMCQECVEAVNAFED